MDRWAGLGGLGGGTGRGGGDGGRLEAAQLLAIADKLLDARELVVCKKFAERAMEADPLLDGAERVVVAADVLLAAQRRRINNHVDWYAVLQLDGDGAPDVSAVRLQYRRLALLLRPSYPPSPAADEAFNLVSDAWAVLSDPAKKELYDKELAIAAAASMTPNGGGHDADDDADADASARASAEAESDDDGSFWTACTNCFYVHQYELGYEDSVLLCYNCRKPFLAAELESPPPIVPGSDMYYCTWGLFPLGFPGGPNFGWPTANGPEMEHDTAGKPWNQAFSPGFPSWWGSQGPVAMGGRVNTDYGNGESHVGFGSAGKKQKWRDSGVGGNQSFSEAHKGKAHGTTTNEKATPREVRKKVMAKRPKKQAATASVVEGGIAATRETEAAIDLGNKGNAGIGLGFVMKPDAGNNAQHVGCSRTVEISAEDLDLNFSIDIDATDNILNSLSTLPFLKDGEMVVVD